MGAPIDPEQSSPDTSAPANRVVVARVALPRGGVLSTTYGAGCVMILGMFSCAAVCLLLTAIALARSETACLPRMTVGLACGFLSLALAIGPNVARKRAQRDLQTVTELKKRTEAGELGRPPPGRGAQAWITEAGIYTSGGMLMPWSTYQAFTITRDHAESEEGQFIVWRAAGRPLAERLPDALLPLAGFILEVSTFGLGLRRYGIRSDVLATLFASLLFVPLLAPATVLRYLRRHRPTIGKGRFAALSLYVRADDDALAVVEALVSGRLERAEMPELPGSQGADTP